MNFKKFEPTDYEMITNWWIKHQHPILPIEMLSPYGLIGYNEKNEAAAVCFMYFVPGADIAMMSWGTTNPDVSARDRYKCLDGCVKSLIHLAKVNNRTNIISFCDSNGTNRIYNKNGLKDLKEHKMMYSKLGVL